jgi:hypothetical protein
MKDMTCTATFLVHVKLYTALALSWKTNNLLKLLGKFWRSICAEMIISSLDENGYRLVVSKPRRAGRWLGREENGGNKA